MAEFASYVKDFMLNVDVILQSMVHQTAPVLVISYACKEGNIPTGCCGFLSVFVRERCGAFTSANAHS